MSISVNKVILAGNIASDIESNQTSNGTPVANFRLAVSNGFGDNENTMFIDVAVFGKAAEAVAKFCQKGSAVMVDGRLNEDQWTTQEGDKRFKHHITVNAPVIFLGGKPRNQDNEEYYKNGYNKPDSDI